MARLTVRTWRDAADSFLSEFIGFAFPPVHHALSAAQWQPDAPGSYCNRCGDSVADGELTESGCATCRGSGDLAGGIADGVVRLGPHADALRDWLIALKYGRWFEMGEWLGGALGRAIRDVNPVDLNRTVIVPVPMPWLRRLYRGVDHTRVIAHAMSLELNVPLISMLKKRNGPPQVSLVMSQRKRQGARGLCAKRRWSRWDLTDTHVLLVDDVRTTGATLKAATRLLRRYKPEKIVCGVLAVSDSTARRKRAEQGRLRQAATAE